MTSSTHLSPRLTTSRPAPLAFVFCVAACLVACLSVAWPGAVAGAQGAEDPALEQTVDADESVAPAGTPAELTAGHADIGPVLTDDGVELMVRDDHAEPPVWRHLDDVVVRVPDAAQQTLPEEGDLSFTGAEPGQDVWVVPQTELAGVPWLGWNTQHPGVVDYADRGVTLELAGFDGPGRFSLFLQNGGFEEPQVLWNSAEEGRQGLWVDSNTHTHANWVFTEPGVYHVAVRVLVTGRDGTERADTRALTFAVGDGTEATAGSWDGTERPADGEAGDGAAEGAGPGSGAGHGSGSDGAEGAGSSDAGSDGVVAADSRQIGVIAGLAGAAALLVALGVWAGSRADARRRRAAAEKFAGYGDAHDDAHDGGHDDAHDDGHDHAHDGGHGDGRTA
ncbi:choice-of-anchor M domain-containing protein [Corynebacterium frankenforstense]